MPRFKRQELMDRFRAMRDAGEAIIGGGAGTGLSAKCEERGGIDLIVVYNSGRFRMAGQGSLAGLMPYGDANAIMLELSQEALAATTRTPILAGVCATDPFRDMGLLLDELDRLGISGVQNFPTVGLIDGTFRVNLEETGFSYAKEVEMVALARERDFLTTPYVFSAEDARAMAAAGADIIVCHLGLTAGGSVGACTVPGIEEGAALVQDWARAALEVNPDAIVLCHGGPVSMPTDAQYVLDHAPDCHGFYGASSMERLPSEIALMRTTQEFKRMTRPAQDRSDT